MEDGKILDLYFQRDEAAITETANKYGAQLKRISYNIISNVQDAEECVNDTYFRAWDAIPPQRPERFFAWLARIARNRSINLYHAQNSMKRSANIVELSEEMAQCVGSGEIQPDDMVLKDALNGFLRGLSNESRYIFIRRYYFADPLGEIAKETGRSENNLASLLLRTRKKLRKYLEKEGISL